jgi:hypothetical protein
VHTLTKQEQEMTPAKFERHVLKCVAPFLGWGGRAEFYEGTLFVSGVMPDEAQVILRELRDQHQRIRMSQMGSYQSDYTFAYDFVA